jgi:ATP-dependent RNA helicase DDX55/SPB4
MWKEFQTINNIDENIIKIIEEELKFDNITKVQNVVIPQFIKNKDVIVKACTGSGKTLSYLIPVLQKLINFTKLEENSAVAIENKILTVILLPSRELSVQVYDILRKFLPLKFTFGLYIGGKKIQKDLEKIKNLIPNIIVATPGRLVDLMERCELSFKDLQILILDEADKMLELGFENKITQLLEHFPKQRRTGLFSATINSQVENLVKVGMRNPIFIDVRISVNADNEDIFIKKEDLIYNNDFKQDLNTNNYFQIVEFENKNLSDKSVEIGNFIQETPSSLCQYYIQIDNIKFKIPTLFNFLKNEISQKMKEGKNYKFMIFFATCNSVDYFSIILQKLLSDCCQNIFKLHSKISQKKGRKNINYFSKAKVGYY